MQARNDTTDTDDDVMHRVMASTTTDRGSTIRLRGYGPADKGPSEWRDVVEIETPTGETIQVGEWDGGKLEAARRYNEMIRPYVGANGEPLNDGAGTDDDDPLVVRIELESRSGGVRHAWRFEGVSDTRRVYPVEMIQGGESHRAGSELRDVPERISRELEAMGYELVTK